MLKKLWHKIAIHYFSDNYRFVRKIKGDHWIEYDMSRKYSEFVVVWEKVTGDQWHDIHYDWHHGEEYTGRCLRFEYYGR